MGGKCFVPRRAWSLSYRSRPCHIDGHEVVRAPIQAICVRDVRKPNGEELFVCQFTAWNKSLFPCEVLEPVPDLRKLPRKRSSLILGGGAGGGGGWAGGGVPGTVKL